MPVKSPVLPGRFSTTGTTWEVHDLLYTNAVGCLPWDAEKIVNFDNGTSDSPGSLNPSLAGDRQWEESHSYTVNYQAPKLTNVIFLKIFFNGSVDITLPTNVRLVRFPVVMYGCESWTVKKAER